uniref:DNA damage-regulated autophagy modulator protein 2 n=1 Tax=Panagrellus redivivus TaxID=6233 RepID=A0A7E4VN14_PANRE
MGLSKVWVIPLLTFVFSSSAFLASYFIAVHLNHVNEFWPYISDSGTTPPESCIFGQLLNLSALFLACSVYLRHRQIVEFYWHQHQQEGKWRSISCFLLFVGYASALGVSIVGNFQENNVIIVHYTGALLAFGCGLVYAWAQTVFSYRMNPKLAKPVVSHFRLLLCIVSTFFFVTMIVFGPILGQAPDNVIGGGASKLYHWTGSEPNYVEHMIGTCSEWILAICFQVYILSFAIELRHAYCHAPKLRLVAYYCDGMAPSESAISVTSGNAISCCAGSMSKNRAKLDREIRPTFNIEMAGLEESFKRIPDTDGMPLGLDAADFVNPARQTAFDKSVHCMKF